MAWSAPTQNTTPCTIDTFTTDITINGTALKGIITADKETVTYFADTNGDTIFGDTGDTAFYKLQLSETANSAAGSYTFTVLVNPPPAELNFTFDQLHSGSNLFGTVGDAANAINVIGEHPVLKADGTLDSSGDVIKTSQGGTGATIGVNSQMFDPTEGAYFTYLKIPQPGFPRGQSLPGERRIIRRTYSTAAARTRRRARPRRSRRSRATTWRR